MEYNYLGTPCENVYGKKACSYPKNVAELFPSDHLLQEMNIEAYIGVPLYTDNEKNIGVLVCLFHECLYEESSITPILEFFAHRVAGEIQLLAAFDDLIKLNKEYLILNEQYQIQNEKLEFALEQTIAEERLKSAFLQNVAHEIRTPMNSILGFSNLLNNDQLPMVELQEYTQYIISSCNQLLSVVNDILYVANIESGQVITNEEELNLNVLLKNLHKGFKEKLTNKNIEFTYHLALSNKDSCIVTDGMKLKQILWNLIMNAIKFTPQGYVRFGYEVKGENVEFYVQDSGIGIDENMWEDIFKPFHQVDSTTNREFDGIGLGLSICAGYVKKLGGKIWFKSELNKGTSLYFTIPYNKA